MQLPLAAAVADAAAHNEVDLGSLVCPGRRSFGATWRNGIVGLFFSSNVRSLQCIGGSFFAMKCDRMLKWFMFACAKLTTDVEPSSYE